MFTGCINHCGKIVDIDTLPVGLRLRIACDYNDLTLGESVAVNGVCLTVTQCIPGEFCCDISPETLAVSSAQYLKINSPVNLERSLRINDRLNGHFVMGHVDQTCKIDAKRQYDNYVEYRFSNLLPAAKPYFVAKGSVAINGVSLTLNEVQDDKFPVMLIPETVRITNLSSLEIGDFVNVEYDYLAKIIAQRQQNNSL